MGLPSLNAFRLLRRISINLGLASVVAQAICGVMMQFLALNNGLSAGGGSVESTSRAAPAMVPWFNASARSFSTMIGPRDVLIRHAVVFLRCRLSRLMSPSVSVDKGQC